MSNRRKKGPKRTDSTRAFRYALLAIMFLVALVCAVTCLTGP